MLRALKEACWLKELVRGWSNVMYETPALASIFKKGPGTFNPRWFSLPLRLCKWPPFFGLPSVHHTFSSFLFWFLQGQERLNNHASSLPLSGNQCAMPECIPFIQPACDSLCWHFCILMFVDSLRGYIVRTSL